ncbi:hypothetical protein RSAG8_12012, partial [Rhizoctonia solani AG-8 WAC10335]
MPPKPRCPIETCGRDYRLTGQVGSMFC